MIFKQKGLKPQAISPASILPIMRTLPGKARSYSHTMDTLLTADPEFLDYSLQSLFRILEASIWFIEHWSRPEWRR